MCTLTYVPKPEGGYIFTSNRDEKTQRQAAIEPKLYSINNVNICYPKDTQAGGTWIATANNGFTLCLLNGAFIKHEPKPPYSKSRGLILLDFFMYNDVAAFVNKHTFSNIEPFTLVIVNKSKQSIHELRWNGELITNTEIPFNEPHIWSSATLYEKDVIEARQEWFNTFIADKNEINVDDMLHFHKFGGVGDKQNDILMNRENKVKTVSITCVEVLNNVTNSYYLDMNNSQIYNLSLFNNYHEESH